MPGPWIPVRTTDNPMDAEWFRDRLALEDIESTIENETVSECYHVCVPPIDRDRATAILDADEQATVTEELPADAVADESVQDREAEFERARGVEGKGVIPMAWLLIGTGMVFLLATLYVVFRT